MIQLLEKYNSWVFLTQAALIILVEFLGAADLPTLMEGLGFVLHKPLVRWFLRNLVKKKSSRRHIIRLTLF